MTSKKAEILDEISIHDDKSLENNKTEVKKRKVKVVNGTSKAKKSKNTTENNKEIKKQSSPSEPQSESKKPLTKRELVSLVEKLFEEMRKITDDTDGHTRTDVFEKLPSKKDYPDYYTLIEKPVSLETILRATKRHTIKDLEGVKNGLDIMFKNAKFYNEAGSWVCNDADALNVFTDKWFAEQSSPSTSE